MSSITLLAPAKINHFLHINGRRANGYHQIQTLFQYLDIGDLLTFTLIATPNIDVSMRSASGESIYIPAEQNLIYKAAYRLQEQYQIASGIKIDVIKNTPMGAGLGGGSSDAATTLLALNYLWELNLDIETLSSIGESLGADVPFFLFGHTAWGEGIGTQLTKTKLAESHVLVLTPPCHVSTEKMFCDTRLTRDTPAVTIGNLEELLRNGQLERAVRNDFETLVCKNYQIVAKYMAWLNQYARAKLSGSGSSVFAVFEQKEEAIRTMKKLPPCWQGFVAKSVNQSPLHIQLMDLGFFFESYWGVAKR